MQSIISRVETFVVRYPVAGHFKFLAASDQPATRDTVLVKITSDEGQVGFGQSVPSRKWSYETLECVRTSIDAYLGPAIIGLNAFDVETVQQAMHAAIAGSFSIGQPICKAGIDLALFDLTGRILEKSACERWGRESLEKVTLSWTISARTLEEAEQSVHQAFEHGFSHFNIKIGLDADFDARLCGEIRRLAPNAFLWADANGGYDLETALAVAAQLADAGIAAFEQPVSANRLSWYAKLRKQGALPILMDEGVVTLADLEEFHALGLLDGVAMKVSRCGGLTEARKILEFVQERELLFFASGLTDPDLSFAASLLLFAAYGLQRPAALNASQFLSGSILQKPLVVVGDQAFVPTGPGLGVEVDEAALADGGDEPEMVRSRVPVERSEPPVETE